MTGKLDEISRLLGRLEEASQQAARDIRANREVADVRHKENTERLDKIDASLAPLARTVKKMEPIVDGVQQSRWQLAGAAVVVSALMMGIGWLVWLLGAKIGAFILWMLSHKA